MPLTIEEKQQFNYFDMLAFDIARMNAAKTDTRIPAWLCMDDDAKARYRQRALDYLNNTGNMPFHLDGGPETEALLQKMLQKSRLDQWMAAETQLKELREQGNLQAWFV